MGFQTIYPRDIERICKSRRAWIADIREPADYRAYHLRGAVNIPYREEEQWIYHFSRRRPVILYCEYGSTSLLAARRLGREGAEVYTVVGGVKAMKEYFGQRF